MELDTVARINAAGFSARTPTWQKRIRRPYRSGEILRTVTEPLFPSYIFLKQDDAFRADKFQTEKNWLTVFWGCRLITEEEMKKIDALADTLTAAQSRTAYSLPVRRGDMLQVIHGLMIGDRVKVLREAQEQLEVDFLDRPGWRPAWINRTSLGRAI